MRERSFAETARHALIISTQTYLLFYIALVCSGCSVGYFPIQKLCLYTPDIIAIICLSLHLYVVRDAGARWKGNVFCLAWCMLFYVWGYAVSSSQAQYHETVLNRLILLPLHFFSVSYVLINKRQLLRLAVLLQIVVLFNLTACILQATHSPLLPLSLRTDIQLSPEQIEYIVSRPVGLWSNSNDVARIFLIIMLISLWLRHPAVWITRIAAMVGIVLSASRFGLLVMAVYGLLGICYLIKAKGLTAFRYIRSDRRLALAAICIIGICMLLPTRQFDVGDALVSNLSSHFTRFTTLGDDLHSDKPDSRAYLLRKGIARLMAGPWYGSGIYTYQGVNKEVSFGVHNMYVTIIGESGWLVWTCFCYIIYLGLRRSMHREIPVQDRLIIQLLWLTWLATGFLSHTMLDDRGVFIIWGLLYTLPVILAKKDVACA